MNGATSSFSPRRVVIGLAVQAAVTAVDIALSSNSLVITGMVLFVPLVLAVIGDWREVAITGAVALVIGVSSNIWNETPAVSQQVYRIAFYAVLAGLAVILTRTRQRATNMAATNEALADELGATRARLDGILGALAEAVTVHDEQGNVVYANPAAAKLLGCESVDDVLSAAPEKLAARFTITDEDGRQVSLDDMPGQQLMGGAETASLLTRSIRDDGEAFWLLTKATLYRDPSGARLAINVIEDVTEAKDAELRERLLAEAGQLLASSLEYEKTLERVTHMVVPRLADWCGIDMLDVRGSSSRSRSRTSTPRRSSWPMRCAGNTRRTWTRPPACPRSCAEAPPRSTPRSPTSCSSPGPWTRSTCGSSARSASSPPWPFRCDSATSRSGSSRS